MRAPLLLACLAGLGACNSEPTFNERYDAQTEKLEGEANGIERELGEQFNAAAASGAMRRDDNAPPSLSNEAAQ